MNFRFALIAVMSLLAAHPQCAVASDGKDPTTCFTDVKVIRTDCTKYAPISPAFPTLISLAKSSGQTGHYVTSFMMRLEKQPFNVSLELLCKPQRISSDQSPSFIHTNAHLTNHDPLQHLPGSNQQTEWGWHAQVQSSVDKILNTCSPQAGSTKLTVKGAEVLVKLGNRSPKDSWKKPFDADFPYDQETCLSVTGTKPIDIRDCMQAFRMIPVDPSGTTFAFRQERRTEITVQQNTCELKISTSDGSPIVASISQVMSAMTKLFKCDTKWGIISIRGAGGPNGRTYIQVQSV
ncbi:hypothetical protein PSTT_00671 [Puccinia striiformis]|uniref:Uncharacterized protein n=1 Tax=Puccinia striiformis TaxID=27350 RepID=A0A2S4W6A9_9BASI|nr:hypothetical protein PSTT_00671 [Puccinia striiformis]